MPALPWRTISAPDRDREYVVMGSRLPLVRYRDLPGFLRATMLIRAQLARASGLTGYALDAHLAQKIFWTLLPRSRTGPCPARTCPSPGRRFGAGSPPRNYRHGPVVYVCRNPGCATGPDLAASARIRTRDSVRGQDTISSSRAGSAAESPATPLRIGGRNRAAADATATAAPPTQTAGARPETNAVPLA
jgi:hypothetical protein